MCNAADGPTFGCKGRDLPKKKMSDVMDPKLTILFMLIGAVLVLSSFGEGAYERVRQQIGFGGNRRR